MCFGVLVQVRRATSLSILATACLVGACYTLLLPDVLALMCFARPHARNMATILPFSLLSFAVSTSIRTFSSAYYHDGLKPCGRVGDEVCSGVQCIFWFGWVT